MLRSIFLVGALALAVPGSAAALTAAGVTFTSVSPGLTLTGLTGTGSAGDPFVLQETITGPDVTVEITDFDTSGVGPAGAFDDGFFLTKEVTNATGSNWTFFDLELQETLGVASSDGDGLSFAQGDASVRPFTSDVFASVFEESTIRDQVNFFDGVVLPGETVAMTFAVSDGSPISPFYLRQRPNFVDPEQPRTDIPVPAALPLLATGAAALFGLARRRRRAD